MLSENREKKMYWLPKHQDLIHTYYYAQYSGITSGQTRNECITKLYPVLERIIRLNMYAIGMPQTDENIQDAMIRIIEYQLPRLHPDKLQGAFNYLWLSTKRYLYNRNTAIRYYHEDIDNYDWISNDNTNDADYGLYIEDVRREILAELDKKIEQQRIINKTSTLILIEMKEYILSNDFDVRGFKEYIMRKMNICEATFASIMSRVNIRSKMFNEKILNTSAKNDFV